MSTITAEQCPAIASSTGKRCEHTILPGTRVCAGGHELPRELWRPSVEPEVASRPSAPICMDDMEDLLAGMEGGWEPGPLDTHEVPAAPPRLEDTHEVPVVPQATATPPPPDKPDEVEEPTDKPEPATADPRTMGRRPVPVRILFWAGRLTRRLIWHGGRFLLREWYRLIRAGAQLGRG